MQFHIKEKLIYLISRVFLLGLFKIFWPAVTEFVYIYWVCLYLLGLFTFTEFVYIYWVCLHFCLGERVIITVEEDEDGGLGYTTTLRITKVSDEDNGKYTLLIKNTAGEAKVKCGHNDLKRGKKSVLAGQFTVWLKG